VEILDVGYFMSLAFGNWFEVSAPAEKIERRRLLLINDSSFSRALIEPVLKGNGYDVIACHSASEALERLADGIGYDAIVSDVDIPDMDGFSLAETIRNDRRTQHLPIIGLAVSNAPEAIARGRTAGFTDYVGKFDRSGLIAALREFAGQKQGVAA
jgi:two-component system, chemotaxis family, sensor kinase CheA